MFICCVFFLRLSPIATSLSPVTPGIDKKLIPKFRGPNEVKKVLDKDRYVVEDIERFQLTRVPFSEIVGPDQMKPWIRL